MDGVVFAAGRFGFYAPFLEVLTDGLIHKTYKVTVNHKSAVLQQVNTNVFKDPEQVVSNYAVVYNHLNDTGALKIPSALQTTDGKNIWIDDEGSSWRAFEYIENSYTESFPATPEKILSAAKCYGAFSRALSGLDVNRLTPTIPGFHDLTLRYNQLLDALAKADAQRLRESEELLEKISERKPLVDFYESLKNNSGFKLRPMHHDTKLSNILFDKTTQQAICPIDLDTTMPGYFFSDVGDMIRSMVSTRDENSPVDSVNINPEIYKAILSGYQTGMGNAFTQMENEYIHHSGLMMLYMQGIRFLTDYLCNDAYYKINYSLQNFDRALNQLTVLEKLEIFLNEKYQYAIR